MGSETSKECKDLTLDQIRYLNAISAFRDIEAKHSVVITVKGENIIFTGENDDLLSQAIQEIKDVPGHREKKELSEEALKEIQTMNTKTIVKELNKLKVKAGWLVDMERGSLFIYSGSRDMAEKAQTVFSKFDTEFEVYTPDIVRYLICVGIPETLKKTYGIEISFTDDNGVYKMAFGGPGESKESARNNIARSQLIKNWKQQWIRLEKCHLQEIHSTTYSEVVERLRVAQVEAGWHADLDQGKLFTYGRDCDAVRAMDIICGMSSHASEDPEVMLLQPLMVHPHTTLNSSLDVLADPANATGELKLQQTPSEPHSTKTFDAPSLPNSNRPRMNIGEPYNPPYLYPPSVKLGDDGKYHLIRYNESISDLEQEKISYLKAIKIRRQVEKKFSVTMKIETKSSFLEISGNSENKVRDAKAMVSDQLKKAVIEPCSSRPQYFIQSLRNVPNEEITAALSSAQVRAGWDIRNGSLIICCDSRPIFSKAEDAIYSLVADGVYPDTGSLGKEQLNILSRPDWKDFVAQLRTSYKSFAWKLEEKYSKRIMFAVCERDSMEVRNSINKFFANFNSVESIVPMRAQDAQILRANLDYIKLFLQPKAGKSVEIIELTDTQCAIASDAKESLRYATEQLNTFVRNIKEFQVTFRRKAQMDWLNSSEGSERIEEISRRTKTAILCKSRSHPTPAKNVKTSIASRLKVVVDDISQIASKGTASGIFSSQGVISKSIKREFQDYMEVEGMSNLALGYTRSVWVYHSRLPDVSADNSHHKHLRNEIINAMKRFSENQVQRVAFPAVGTGNLGYSPQEVANTMIDAINYFLQINQHSSIQEVYLVAFSSSEQIYHEFKRKLMELETVKSDPSSDRKGLMVSAWIRGLVQTHVDDAYSRILKELQKLLSTEEWKDSPVKSYITMLTYEQRMNIRKEASVRDIEVTFMADNISINGAKEDVRFLHGYIDKILHSYIDSGVKLPRRWNMKAMVDGYAEVVLDPYQNRTEYMNVSGAFGKTMKQRHRITEIRRVQNAGAYKMYMSYLDVVSKKLKREQRLVESWPLWHGTDHNTVCKITKGKFDRGLSGKNATAYGLGCYFAREASYSARSTYSPPNSLGEKVIILTGVITGDYCLGNSSYRAAPYKPGSDEQYDSVVDNTSSPSMYIVFEDRAALAEYIIKFYLVNRAV